MTISTLFSGIGAPETALKRLGIDYKLAYFCDIDKYAVKSYCAIHGEPERKNLGDITKIDIDKLPKDLDLIVGGSPCQDFSTAGKGAGGDIGTETRSSLMWNYVEIIRVTQPKAILWENVLGVLTTSNIHNYNKFCNRLNEIGYKVYSKVLNAKDFGVPQNRKRIFVVGIRKDLNIDFTMPSGYDCGICLKDFLENTVDKKYYLTKKQIEQINSWKCYQNPLLCAQSRESKYSQTITAKSNTSMNASMLLIKAENGKYRKYTPLECWRLMGFSDSDFYVAQKVNSNAQLYKQAGNSIVVNVLMAILGQLYKVDWKPLVYSRYYKTETERMAELPLLTAMTPTGITDAVGRKRMKVKLLKFRENTFDYEALVDDKKAIVDPFVSNSDRLYFNNNENDKAIKAGYEREGLSYITKNNMLLCKDTYIPFSNDFKREKENE